MPEFFFSNKMKVQAQELLKANWDRKYEPENFYDVAPRHQAYYSYRYSYSCPITA